jgi:hypothetical protein
MRRWLDRLRFTWLGGHGKLNKPQLKVLTLHWKTDKLRRLCLEALDEFGQPRRGQGFAVSNALAPKQGLWYNAFRLRTGV